MKQADQAFLIFLIVFVFVVVLIVLNIRGAYMNSAHNIYVRNQEICAVRGAWYVPEENYHGLISCRRLDTHEQFYMVPSTGLALVPVVD